MARVLWRDAQGKEGSLELGRGDAVIGRAMDCAIRTDDAMVSRNHARLLFDGATYYVEDLGSANGVFYQEQRVTRHPLQHGDAVRCGSLWLRFIDTALPAAPPPMQAPMAGPFQQPPMQGAAMGGPMPGGPMQGGPMQGGAMPGPAPAPREYEMTPMVGSTPSPSPSPSLAPQPNVRLMSVENDELSRLRRKVEQLQSEIKVLRGAGERANHMQQLENELERLNGENHQLRDQLSRLQATHAAEGGDAKVRRAGLVAQTAAEIVAGLNDVLSNLRINVMAAEGEFDQFAQHIPRASFELIREALRSSARDMELARDLLRRLREIAS